MQTDSSFDTDTTAYKLIGKLSELRQQNDAIAYGTTTIRYSNDDVLIYERKFYDDVILVAINRQPDKAYTIDNVETLLPEGEYVDFLGGMLNGENISVYASTGINTTASITLDGGEVGVGSTMQQPAHPKSGMLFLRWGVQATVFTFTVMDLMEISRSSSVKPKQRLKAIPQMKS